VVQAREMEELTKEEMRVVTAEAKARSTNLGSKWLLRMKMGSQNRRKVHAAEHHNDQYRE
jgi:hypothetical protein